MIVALVAIALALAVGHRTVWVLLAETRLRLGIGKANPALETILSSGNDAALARLARFVVMERNSERGRYARRQLEAEVGQSESARALIPHLLRLAASIDDDGDRGAALETLGLIANAKELWSQRGSAFVHRDGELFFSVQPGFHMYVAERAPRAAVFAWADWLVAHGFLARDDSLLGELGPPPPPYDGPPRIGVIVERLVVKVVVPDLPADRAGILPGDHLCTVDGAPIAEVGDIGRALMKKDTVVVVVETKLGQGPQPRNVTIRR